MASNPSPEALVAAERAISTVWDMLPVDHTNPADMELLQAVAALIDAAYAERLERLERENERLRGELDRIKNAAKQIAASNTMLRKIAAHVRGVVWIKAKEDAGFGTAIHAQINDPKADEAWLEFVSIRPDEKNARAALEAPSEGDAK